MQAFRVATTIDEENHLHLVNVPFRPGTAVDVIVLERGIPSDSLASGRQLQQKDMAEEQYRLAGQHPGEYVVLVGERIVHHGANRQQAVRAYQRAGIENPSSRPVFVSPGDVPKKPLVVRGRALARKRDGMRCLS